MARFVPQTLHMTTVLGIDKKNLPINQRAALVERWSVQKYYWAHVNYLAHVEHSFRNKIIRGRLHFGETQRKRTVMEICIHQLLIS